MNTIANNLSIIQSKLEKAVKTSPEHKNSPKQHGPRILAACKTRSCEEIREAYAAGISLFGENYLQEASHKIDALNDLDIEWHFIGPVQSNKCKAIAQQFSWVQTIDRLKIAQGLNKYSEIRQSPLNVCIQVNLDLESSKSGVKLEEIDALATQISQLPYLKLRGLMTIPKGQEGLLEQRASFARMHEKFQHLAQIYSGFDTLSMGMSKDYEAAILEGSTLVRLGTALFGPRPS